MVGADDVVVACEIYGVRERKEIMDQKQAGIEIRKAIMAGDLEAVRQLIEADKSRLEMMTPFGTWLHVAASRGQLEIVKYLLLAGIDLNRRGGVFEAAPIKEAASDGHIKVVRCLLDAGAELDVSEPERNPLFGAIYGGHLEIVKVLIEQGIDTKVAYTGNTMQNMDAVAFAKERGQTEIAKYLEALG